MAEFLSQDEINDLLGVIDKVESYPLYLYIKHTNGSYEILEMTETQAQELTGLESDIDMEDVKKAFDEKGIEIKLEDTKKGRFIKSIKTVYDNICDAEKQLECITKVLNDNPEYIL